MSTTEDEAFVHRYADLGTFKETEGREYPRRHYIDAENYEIVIKRMIIIRFEYKGVALALQGADRHRVIRHLAESLRKRVG